MNSIFNKDILRSITHSLGRFLSIAIIAALGVGFYAALRMTGPDMRLAGDEYYDGTHLSDIRVMSSLGLGDEDVETLRGIEGVEAVMPGYQSDVIAEIADERYTVSIHSLDTESALASDTSDGTNAVSDNEDYINRLILVEGAFPQKADECVIGADVVMGTDVQIGDTVTLIEGTQDLEDTFEVKEYTITGFVRSSYYASPTSLGSTSLGNGALDQFVYVPETAFSADLPYTEAYLTIEGARDELSGSDSYQAVVDEVLKRIDELEPQLVTDRTAAVKAEAQEELDEGWEEFEKEKADALQQLDDAEAELQSGKRELDDAKAQLNDAWSTIVSSEKEIEDGWDDYNGGVKELKEQRKAAEVGFADAEAQLETNKAQLDVAWAQAGITYEQAQGSLSAIQQGIEQAEQALAALPDTEDYAEQRKKLEETIASLKTQAQGLQTLISYQEQYDAGVTELNKQKQTAEQEFAFAEQQLASAKQKLERGEAQLKSGKNEYYAGKSEYERGLAEYNSGKAEFEEEKADALRQLDDAEAELKNAQKDIDDIEKAELYVLDRTKYIGAESFRSDATRIDQIAQVFPFIFFLVAALVSLTTMTRMVNEERILIGTYKALGYSRARITSKYIVYALVASLIGGVIGLIALTQFLPYFIMNAYAIVYAVPPRPTPIDIPTAAIALGLGIGITLLATWYAATSTLHEVPASLMQPRAPKAGKRILLERVKPVWKRLSFSWKVTARNIFRYKQRFFMAIVGIAGCTALLLTGFGLQNAINDIIDKQFYEIYRYDMVVRADDDVLPSEKDNLVTALDNCISGDGVASDIEAPADGSQLITEYLWTKTENMIAVADGVKDQRFELVVPEDPATFQDYITLRERVGHESLELTDEGAILSEKFASQLGVSVGDTIEVYEEDTVGNAMGEPYTIPVAGITEFYVNQYLFMTPTLYGEVFGEQPHYATVYARATTDVASRAEMSSMLLEQDGVKTVSYNDEQIDSYRTMLKSVDSVVVVLIIASAALAFVVLYNLTNINISERQREIATLKVLGFTRQEVNSYIFRETMILSIIGALVGLFLGIFLEAFVVQTAEVDMVMFGREIHGLSFLISFALTMVFTVLVMWFMHPKLARIDMVESLKSNE